jgi:ankyrin repeat protein
MKNIHGYETYLTEAAKKDLQEMLNDLFFQILSTKKKADPTDVKRLLDVGITDLDTGLRFAIRQGNIEAVKMIIDAGANPNGLGTMDVHSPIAEAASDGYIEIAELLLNKGANVNGKSRQPTVCAAILGNVWDDIGKPMPNLIQFFRLLIEHGADVNATDVYGGFPLYYIVEYRTRLDQKRSSNKFKKVYGDIKNPLSVELASVLIEAGAIVDQRYKNPDGDTPLEYLVNSGSYRSIYHADFDADLARLFIDNGADMYPSFKNEEELKKFFNGDVSWIPESVMRKFMRKTGMRGMFSK